MPDKRGYRDRREYQRQYWQDHYKGVVFRDPEKRRDDHLKTRYGITLKQYEDQVEAQGSICPICKEVKKLVVDHDHETGKVRGLICSRCNQGLWWVEKSGYLESALHYLGIPARLYSA